MSGKRNTTKTATSFGYGVKSQTSVPTKSSIKPYRSRFEFNIALWLEQSGVAFEYEPKKISYLHPVHQGTCLSCASSYVGRRSVYLPDFWLPEQKLWIEAKGRWPGSGRTKTLAVLSSDNELTLENFRMLFMYDNWLTKKHRQTYTGWCQAQGIICATGVELPKEWLNT
ncbi:MAG: hypothetical protein ACKJRP_04225 [SAR86 cluster bacterium]